MPYSAGAQSGMLAQFSAFHIPTVTSDLLSFKLWNESTGGGITSFTDDEFAVNICKIIGNEDVLSKMRENIRQSNQQKYWNVIAEKHMKIYEALVVKEDQIAEFFYVPKPK